MADEPTSDRHAERARAESEPHDALIQRAQATLRATSALALVLGDRLAYACAVDVEALLDVPAEHLVQLIAVADALQDGACRTLWHIDPELARNGRIIARLARDTVGGR